MFNFFKATKNNEEFQERRGEQSVKNINNIGVKCG